MVNLLTHLGFERERTTGSHEIYKAPTGSQVVVPRHPNIPIGTIRSIAEKPEQALNPKNHIASE